MENLNFENANVYYFKDYLDANVCLNIFEKISNIFGSEEHKMVHSEDDKPLYRLNRKTVVFVDNTVDITVIPKIWGKNVSIIEFPKELANVKQNLEKLLNFKFNICLANYYTHGKKAIGWHSDNEEKGSTSCIASISLGAEREFMFRKKDSKDIYKKIVLNHGSLIVMAEGCQENYHHSLPVDKSCEAPRLNLTFRLFDSNRYVNY
ncbi:hypothetical protein QJ857_gp1281 [Tupanvirus soda lake]|uniref:Fe2OG dioxygenase domain-containing protein n=2 Tax=Tupanvirus TaxID=2094720 RepID=A0A6N1NKD3_9VIRU|nr:hypothetical protein QJ857_gp1281 [Tupanvirus soda lake]QKU34780.1 hypothetical protein [Tupanvirus soda lake]